MMIFRTAYTCIMRVATLEADSIFDVRENGGRLPVEYIGLAGEFVSFEAMRALFCPMNKEKAIDFLIKYCFGTRVQPGRFIFMGLLSIDRRRAPVEEHVYVYNEEQF